jgi:large subunit ribosomal protein L21
MYAILDVNNRQYKVKPGQEIYVDLQSSAKAGDSLKFDKVLLAENDGKINVGVPALKNASVSASVIEHVKGDKVIVFKKKRRKGYRVKNGHRQQFTKVRIDGISL